MKFSFYLNIFTHISIFNCWYVKTTAINIKYIHLSGGIEAISIIMNDKCWTINHHYENFIFQKSSTSCRNHGSFLFLWFFIKWICFNFFLPVFLLFIWSSHSSLNQNRYFCAKMCNILDTYIWGKRRRKQKNNILFKWFLFQWIS